MYHWHFLWHIGYKFLAYLWMHDHLAHMFSESDRYCFLPKLWKCKTAWEPQCRWHYLSVLSFLGHHPFRRLPFLKGISLYLGTLWTQPLFLHRDAGGLLFDHLGSRTKEKCQANEEFLSFAFLSSFCFLSLCLSLFWSSLPPTTSLHLLWLLSYFLILPLLCGGKPFMKGAGLLGSKPMWGTNWPVVSIFMTSSCRFLVVSSRLVQRIL